jgi:hypothetical protein
LHGFERFLKEFRHGTRIEAPAGRR